MEENRKNWIAELNNGRYIVVDKTTGIIINEPKVTDSKMNLNAGTG